MNKQKKKKTFKTNCHNCTGNGKQSDPLGLIFNIRNCTKTKCSSWQFREYKLGGQI